MVFCAIVGDGFLVFCAITVGDVTDEEIMKEVMALSFAVGNGADEDNGD